MNTIPIESKRILIAKEDGWKSRPGMHWDGMCITPDGKLYWLPDYYHSLDDIQKAVLKVFDNPVKLSMFCETLLTVCKKENHLHWTDHTVVATARQRFEAFGIAIGLWQEISPYEQKQNAKEQEGV